MTPEQKKAATNAKIAKVTALCKELKIVLQAEQAVMETGLIKNIIYYIDLEEYV